MPLTEEDVVDWVCVLGLMTDMEADGMTEAEGSAVYSKAVILYMEVAEILISPRGPSGR